MSCHRLTFKNDRVFDVMIAAAEVADELKTNLCTGVLYRVTGGVREAEPLHRTDGGPIQVIATTEQMVLEIATHVLGQVTGSALDQTRPCDDAPGFSRLLLFGF